MKERMSAVMKREMIKFICDAFTEGAITESDANQYVEFIRECDLTDTESLDIITEMVDMICCENDRNLAKTMADAQKELKEQYRYQKLKGLINDGITFTQFVGGYGTKFKFVPIPSHTIFARAACR